MTQIVEASVRCKTEGCADPAVASLEARSLCRKHFLTSAYQQLEAISTQIQDPSFHEIQGEAVGRFLEECMRCAADIACAPAPPSNLERAQVLDVLLWASELHGKLRRGPRVRKSIPIRLRSESQNWEEEAETQLLSRHGFQLCCDHEVNVEDRVTCMRDDTDWQVEARVVWVRRLETGQTEAGFEFLHDENFWGLTTWAAPSVPRRRR